MQTILLHPRCWVYLVTTVPMKGSCWPFRLWFSVTNFHKVRLAVQTLLRLLTKTAAGSAKECNKKHRVRTTRVYKSNIHSAHAPPPRGGQTDHSLRLDRGTPEWADSRTPGSAKALRLEAACHQPADNLVRVWAGCQQKSRTRAGLVALKHEEALMQIHLMLVLLGSKKSPTQTHLLKRKQ